MSPKRCDILYLLRGNDSGLWGVSIMWVIILHNKNMKRFSQGAQVSGYLLRAIGQAVQLSGQTTNPTFNPVVLKRLFIESYQWTSISISFPDDSEGTTSWPGSQNNYGCSDYKEWCTCPGDVQIEGVSCPWTPLPGTKSSRQEVKILTFNQLATIPPRALAPIWSPPNALEVSRHFSNT